MPFSRVSIVIPSPRCGFCGERREISEDDMQRLILGADKYNCLLCGVNDHTACDGCFFPWSTSYVTEGCIDATECSTWVKLEEPGQHVCSLCIVQEEHNLQIVDKPQ